MTEHVPNDLLHDFVDGDMDEGLAVHIAEHLDLCPHCATRAATLDPLAAAFASCDDPSMPEGLPLEILQELARRPAARGNTELVVGGCLLALAAALAAATQHPVTLLADLGALLSASGALVRGVALGLSPYAVASGTAMVAAGVGAGLTLRIAQGPAVLDRVDRATKRSA